MFSYVIFAGGLAIASAVAFVAHASEIQLVIDGDVNEGFAVNFTGDNWLALPQVHFDTSTGWTNRLHRLSGPALTDVLRHYDARPGDVRLTAVNAYSVTVNRDIIISEAPIIANRIVDQPFDRRDNGPLWVVFPYDRAAKFKREAIFSASVWQLVQITVLAE